MIFPGFDSFTDLTTAIARAHREVTAVRQQRITHGDRWCGPSPGGGVTFGEIATVAELDELESSRDERAEDFQRGYRFGRTYSTVSPGGVWASTHVSQMTTELSSTQFEDARTAGWDFGVLVREGLTWPNPLLHRR